MTTDHDRYADEIAAYALGALNELETTAFERHLMRCQACAQELASLRGVVDALPAAVPQYRARPELKRAVMDIVGPEAAEPVRPARARRRPSWTGALRMPRPSLALAGGLASLALAFGAYAVGTSVSEPERRVLTASVDRTQLPGARARLAASGDLGVLRAADLPPAGKGRVYVVWIDRGHGPVYSSSFNVEPDGTGEAGVPELDGVRRVMVTRESSTAVAHPTENPVLTVQVG